MSGADTPLPPEQEALVVGIYNVLETADSHAAAMPDIRHLLSSFLSRQPSVPQNPNYEDLAAECIELRKINSLLLADREATPELEVAIASAGEAVEWLRGLDADIQAAKVQGLIDAVLKPTASTSPSPAEAMERAAQAAFDAACPYGPNGRYIGSKCAAAIRRLIPAPSTARTGGE